jgi:hypothetical protein
MPKGVTAKYISAQQYDIHNQNEAPDPDSESVGKAEGHHRVIGQKSPHWIGKPQKITMKVLQNQWKAPLSEIALPRFTDGTRGWVDPERFVVCAAVVVARQPEEARYPQNEKSRREWQKARIPSRLRTEERMRRVAEEFRRIKR